MKAIGTALLLVLFLFGAAPGQTDTLGGRFILGDPMAADPTSGYWTNLTTGDVDNDGYPDIAAAHGYRRAGLYLHNGARSFAAERVFSETWWRVSANIGASSIALGDLDRDGNLDMVIPIYGDHFREHMVQIHKGHGDGTFALWPVDGFNAPVNFEGVNRDGVDDGIIVATGAANPMFPLIADFNGDGRPDVAVSANNGAHSVDVLLQSVNQEFSVSDSNPAGQNPQFMDLGDFNEDGYPDVVAGSLYTGVLVFLNDAFGKGTLHQQGGTYLSHHHQHVVVADFNRDGHQDIAARGNQDARVYILYGTGTGIFPSTANFPVSGIDGYLAVADIDNDGDVDLVVASTSTNSVDLLLNDGSGHFGSPESTTLNAAPWGIAADDLDQDGFVDVAVSRLDNTVQVLWNRGNRGRYSDLNADGKADLVWHNVTTGANQAWLLNVTTNPAIAPVSAKGALSKMPDPTWHLACVADFNGDGKSDLLWRHGLPGETVTSYVGLNQVWLMNGATRLGVRNLNAIADLDWQVAGCADFDGDRRADIVWHHGVSGLNRMWLLDVSTDPVVAPVRTAAGLPRWADSTWHIVGTADYNGDGKADILWRHGLPGESGSDYVGVNQVWLMDGATRLAQRNLWSEPDLDWQVAGTGDYDADGIADIVWRHGTSGLNRLWLLKGGPDARPLVKTAGALAPVTDLIWQIVATGDYNGDGRADILWRHGLPGEGGSGANQVWLMNGATRLGVRNINPVSDLDWQPAP